MKSTIFERKTHWGGSQHGGDGRKRTGVLETQQPTLQSDAQEKTGARSSVGALTDRVHAADRKGEDKEGTEKAFEEIMPFSL